MDSVAFLSRCFDCLLYFALYISVRVTGQFYGISEGILLQSLAGCKDQVIHTDYEDADGSYSAIYTMEDGSNFWMAVEDEDKREKVPQSLPTFAVF